MQQDKLSGTIDRFLFQSTDDRGFTVFVLITKHDSITVKGNLPPLHIGQEVEITGTWVMHQKFGKQFEAQQCITHTPSSIIGLKKYLGSGLIKGIGKVYAEKLVNHFGADILTVIDTQPHRLAEVDGIGPKRIETICRAWKDQKSIADIMVFLQDKGITPAFAAKIYKQYRHESLAVLHENPYKLADDIWGIGFKTADHIAQKLGFKLDAPQRITSGILFALSQAATQGHLYVELNDLKEQTLTLLELGAEHKELLKKSFYDLYHADRIKLITEQEIHYIGLAQHYGAEVGVAKKIITLQTYPSRHTFDLDAVYTSLRTPQAGHVMLNEQQQKGIMAAVGNKITIITGGPGTGKTTLIKQLLTVLENNKVRYKLAAPTGRAAQRITEGTGRYAMTIHRLLEFDPSIMRFSYNETHALDLDFLIIDETSMIDIFLAHAIVKALSNGAHLVLIGDTDQLPSVGAGNFLNDLIASSLVPCIRLTEVFRQAQDSLIIVNAHRVNKGEFPISFLPDARKDFLFIKEEEPTHILNHLKRALFIELKKHNISLSHVQILAPMNRSIVGTQALNHSLQELLNGGVKDSIVHAGTTYKLGDKVMQIRNNYDKAVFNGDIGIITAVNLDEKSLEVTFNERNIEYEFDELNEIVLAYATTIHKSQGSEYQAAIIVVYMQHFVLLQRNLIYTAITRAKKLCIIIGQPRALAMAIKNKKSIQRVTFLKKFLQEYQ